jgi:hypothetical protein
MSLPIRLAGLGIARQKENAAIAWLSSLLESLPSFLRPDATLPPFYETLRLQATDMVTSELIQLGRPDLVEKLHTILPKDAAASLHPPGVGTPAQTRKGRHGPRSARRPDSSAR